MHGGHLPALHLAGAALGVEHDDVDAPPVATRLDRRRAGVARRRADDGHPLAALGQHVVEQPPEQLHRHVLERQRRPVEQLQRPQVRVQLHQRRHRRVAEARAVRLAAQSLQRRERDALAHEGLHHPGRDLRIRQAAHGAQVGGGQGRPGLGHEQATVLGKPREEHAGEVARGGLPAGGDVAHGGHSRAGGGRKEGWALLPLSVPMAQAGHGARQAAPPPALATTRVGCWNPWRAPTEPAKGRESSEARPTRPLLRQPARKAHPSQETGHRWIVVNTGFWL